MIPIIIIIMFQIVGLDKKVYFNLIKVYFN